MVEKLEPATEMVLLGKVGRMSMTVCGKEDRRLRRMHTEFLLRRMSTESKARVLRISSARKTILFGPCDPFEVLAFYLSASSAY